MPAAAAKAASMPAGPGASGKGIAKQPAAVLSPAAAAAAHQQDEQQATTISIGQQQQAEYYQFPLPLDTIKLVQDLQGIQDMQQQLLGPPYPAGGTAGSNSRASGTSTSTSSVVGIDCEWQPYHKGPRTPVALLQLATRQQVYLVDLLALCRQPVQPVQPGDTVQMVGAGAGVVSSSNRGAGSGLPDSLAPTQEEVALATCLQRLFADGGIIKLGYQQGDLQRLAQSYPQLCCSAAAGAGAAGALHGTEAGLAEAPGCSSDNGNLSSAGAGTGGLGNQPHSEDGTASTTAGVSGASSTLTGAPSGSGSSTDESGLEYVSGWAVRQLLDVQQLLGPTNPRKFQISLSRAVQAVLGKPLDKTQQASDWAMRPLTCEQLVYAANDAHVLTVLYDKLHCSCTASAAGRPGCTE